MNNKVRETFTDTIYEVGKEDKKLCVIVSDISHFRLQKFAKENPNRYYNLGVCENSIVNVAAGIAHLGFIPVVHTFASFLIDKSFEQLKLTFGYNKLPVNLIAIGSGIEYSFHGVTHHSYIDSLLIKSIENSSVFNPGSTYEFDELFKKAYNNNKINLFRATSNSHEIDLSEYDIEPGKGILYKKGTDLTIISTGFHLRTAVDSISKFEENNISVEIIYLPTIKPLDKDLILDSVKKTSKFIVMEHQSEYGGLYSDISSMVLKEKSKNKICGRSISLGNKFVHEYGNFSEHNLRLNFTPEGLLSNYNSMKDE
jgi:transketolase